MYPKRVRAKILGFIILFTIVFFTIRTFGLIPSPAPSAIPWFFSGISLIFSIISGFVIQSKWQTWNELIDATHGEVASLKQLHMLANHFPTTIQHLIRSHIQRYLALLIDESYAAKKTFARSEEVERAIYHLEETVLDIDYKEHPNIGSLAFDLVRKCLEYREKRLQNISHKLPRGVKLFVINATIAVIIASLFIGEDTRIYDYFLTLIIALLSYGIYLLIDDLDNPYRPGQWHLTNADYVTLSEEVERSLKEPEKNHTLAHNDHE
jgi:predicted kinase